MNIIPEILADAWGVIVWAVLIVTLYISVTTAVDMWVIPPLRKLWDATEDALILGMIQQDEWLASWREKMRRHRKSRRKTVNGQDHSHDSFRCPAHIDFCDCPELESYACNPYHVPGFCPDDIEMMPWSGIFHAITPDGQTPASCCGKLPGEINGTDAMTGDPSEVNCPGREA